MRRKVDTRNSHSYACGLLSFCFQEPVTHQPSFVGTGSLLATAVIANILLRLTMRRTGMKTISSDSTVLRFIAVVFYFPARSASKACHASGKPPVKRWRRQYFGSGYRESKNRATLYCVCCLAHRQMTKRTNYSSCDVLTCHAEQTAASLIRGFRPQEESYHPHCSLIGSPDLQRC